jgi:hypothetical protein
MALIYSNEDYDILKDIYRIVTHAAETAQAQVSQSDRERVAMFWKDMLRVSDLYLLCSISLLV